MAEREAWVYKAKLAENAERYGDMAAAVKEVAASGEGLSVEERGMVSVAYANLIGSARASWRVVSSILKREEHLGEEKVEWRVRLARALVRKLEGEMDSICQECVALIDNHLLPSASDLDSQTFFLKQKGDYLRYKAEYASGERCQEAIEAARLAYQSATDVAQELPPTHLNRMGLALNFCVFYRECMQSPHQACQIAEQAVDEANNHLNCTGQEDRDTRLVIQLLEDNLALWASEMQKTHHEAGQKTE